MHPFLSECTLAQQIWCFFCLEANRKINLTVTTMELTKNWSTSCFSARGKEVRSHFAAAISWVTWECNAMTFNNKERKADDEVELKVFQWARHSSCMSDTLVCDVIARWKELFFDPPWFGIFLFLWLGSLLSFSLVGVCIFSCLLFVFGGLLLGSFFVCTPFFL